MLFNIMFGAIVHASRQKYEQEGLGVQVMENNGVFTGRRRRPEHSPTFIMRDIADDLSLFAEAETELQQMVNIYHTIATAYGQEISIKNTRSWVPKPRDQLVCCHRFLASGLKGKS
jgi:hypothetical protein